MQPTTKAKRAYYIASDGTAREVKPNCGDAFTLEDLQRYVGGYIERVRLSRYKTMYVNEDGRLMHQVINITATNIARQAEAIFPTDYIVGNVILIDNTKQQ